MTRLLRRILACTATLLVAAHAHAFEAGWMQIRTAGAPPDAPSTTVALYYPTLAPPRGPYPCRAANARSSWPTDTSTAIYRQVTRPSVQLVP